MKADIAWTKDTETVAAWLKRDYPTNLHWASVGQKLHLELAGTERQANSDKTRASLARVLQNDIEQLGNDPVAVDQWAKDLTGIVTIHIQPPKATKNVQWDLLADYVLLAAAVSWCALEDENERRRKENDKRKRAFKKALKSHPTTKEPAYLPTVELYKSVYFPVS